MSHGKLSYAAVAKSVPQKKVITPTKDTSKKVPGVRILSRKEPVPKEEVKEEAYSLFDVIMQTQASM